MQVHHTPHVAKSEFEPFDLTISFDTLQEAAQFYAVFDHGMVTSRVMPDVDQKAIRDAIEESQSILITQFSDAYFDILDSLLI